MSYLHSLRTQPLRLQYLTIEAGSSLQTHFRLLFPHAPRRCIELERKKNETGRFWEANFDRISKLFFVFEIAVLFSFLQNFSLSCIPNELDVHQIWVDSSCVLAFLLRLRVRAGTVWSRSKILHELAHFKSEFFFSLFQFYHVTTLHFSLFEGAHYVRCPSNEWSPSRLRYIFLHTLL